MSGIHLTTRASREGSQLATLTFLNGGSRTGEGVQDRAFQKVIKDTQDRVIQAISNHSPSSLPGFEPFSPQSDAYQFPTPALGQHYSTSPHKIDNHTQTYWMCLPLSQRAYLATPIPLAWEAPENLKTNTSVLTGPLATEIHLTNANNLICTVPEGMNSTSL